MISPDPLEEFRAEEALSGLFDFQRDAVDHAFDRLYLAPDSSRRFLIADEVGLGKTMIARGILARAVEHLRDKVRRIDVVYICSNLSIARQNIKRLNPMESLRFSDAERITLLPIHLQSIADHRVNFVAFTPSTSLELNSSLGRMRERVLLHEMLRDIWQLTGTGPLNVLQGGVRDAEYFRGRVKDFRSDTPISKELLQGFSRELDVEAVIAAQAGRVSLRARFEALSDQFQRVRQSIPVEQRQERARVVGALRGVLAKSCIAALEPDLVILDEFQRFKDLLGGEEKSEAAELAEQLFSWSEGHIGTRVLLLSATPYKPYTLQHELAQDDHYADFLRTVAFLDNNSTKTEEFRGLLTAYQHELYRLRDGHIDELLRLKHRIEAHLRRIMSRTERLTSSAKDNGMLTTVVTSDLRIAPEDLRSYVQMKAVTDELEIGDAIEYWKSAAYAFNFMEGYEFKRALQDRLSNGRADAVHRVLREAARDALDFDKVASYDELPFPNARLRYLLADLHRTGAFLTLWLPPGLPFYKLGSAFDDVDPGLSKKLIFSAWHLVPRSIASLLTYEAERVSLKLDEPAAKNNEAFRDARRGRLRFARSEGRLTGLPLFTLFYPSRVLAELCDPRKFVRHTGRVNAPFVEVLAWAEEQIRHALLTSIVMAEAHEAADEAWYWQAPIALDSYRYREEVEKWWADPCLETEWIGNDGDSDEVEQAWLDHVRAAREEVRRGAWPSGKAPHDLPRVLALIGLSAPATSALRALWRVSPQQGNDWALHHRTAAARIGAAFRGLLNRPESIAIIRRGSQEPYWKRVLEYCGEGCLSAVLEEFLHLTCEAQGAAAAKSPDLVEDIADDVVKALQIRTSSLRVDRIHTDESSGQVRLSQPSMRSLFAARFGSDKTEDEGQVQRDTSLREAFNSPFWPFVLATTSVGQEGLDFHTYCHAVVHWNLPSNPVDLEQREGRVQRFKGHAVRKNVAGVHGLQALRSDATDPWKEAFRLALADAPVGDRGLHPYWLYPVDRGATIERHVPLYPLSKDEIRLKRLVRSLAAYRMVVGQSRQEELLAYLLDFLPADQVEKYSALLRMDLAPPTRSTGQDLPTRPS